MTSVDNLFKIYGITGIPFVDTLILTNLIPIILSYITIVRDFLSRVIVDKCAVWYHTFKEKFIGKVDFRLNVSQERSIYPAIRSIFFSSTVKSDPIGDKMIGLINLIIETKDTKYSYYYDDEMYDLYMNDSNHITMEKHMDCGTAIAKKYFEFNDYYIVVSENKKMDYSHYFSKYTMSEKKDEKKDDKKDTDQNTEYFILFEAIRKSNSVIKNNSIIINFLHERFRIGIRIPYKYVIDITDSLLVDKFRQHDKYINEDFEIAELITSDRFEKFKNHPKVKDFYSQESNVRVASKSGISSFLKVSSDSNILNEEELNKDIHFTTTSSETTSNIFSPSFNSIIKYFFGKRFDLWHEYFFYFRENKIILFGRCADDNKYYVCIISFQQILIKEDIIQIFQDTLPKKNSIKGTNTKIKIYTYQGEDGWDSVNCDSRSFDTIYLPIKIKNIVMNELDKFMCFKKVFKENGIPYKKGFLFYGPPGTGKTSLVKALACQYDIPIYIFDINNGSINDENITQTINSISGSGNRILLFEDIDSAFSDKEELKYQSREDVIVNVKKEEKEKKNDMEKSPSKKFLTYSGLLNALDGVMSNHAGTIMIMTTNYYEKLGQALIRPGRIDFCLELTFCDKDQIVQMTHNIIKSSYKIIHQHDMKNILFHNPYNDTQLCAKIEEFADNIMCNRPLSTIKPCELQTFILRHIENVEHIFNCYHELLK